MLPWWQYRANFVTEQRIADGMRFWLAHQPVLESVAKTSGVAPEYIVAILGCETSYGRITGKDRVLDSLATLAFDYPPRGEFFRAELLQFLLLSKEAHLNPLTVKGSYSGAMGAPQFMPSSYRHYGVDADANRHIDLWNDWRDIFASVANLLRTKRLAARCAGAGAGAAGARGRGAGATAHAGPDRDARQPQGLGHHDRQPAARRHTGGADRRGEATGPAFRVGFNNFYVLSRYNRSARYSMAVADLAQAIAERVHD